MKKVIFVNYGGIGEKENYERIIDSFSKILERTKRLANLNSQEETKAAEVIIVNTPWELKRIIMTESVDAVVFFSRSMANKAREIIQFAKQNGRFRKEFKTIILTGLINAEEIIFLPKGSSNIVKIFTEAVLDWPVGPKEIKQL